MKPGDALAIVNAKRGDLDAALVMAFCEVESEFNERAFRIDRNGGSFGLMQLDLPTARDRGFTGKQTDLFDPSINVTYGVAQLVWIKATLARNSALGLQALIAAYNEGVGNVLRGNPDPVYVGKVIAARDAWRRALGAGAA